MTKHPILISELMRRTGEGAKLGLERVEQALASLGNPEAALNIVHVAGTNGKGSTSAMVEAIARAAGIKTGLYTSPHLSRFRERIRIDGELIDEALFCEALERAMADAMPQLSFFEVLTVAAFWAMRETNVELAVFEVGLGGRLDATNVVSAPRATAITSIGRDHQRFLGDSLASIAREKAGIIKPSAPLVLGRIDDEPLAAILEIAGERGASPIWSLSRAATVEAIALSGSSLQLPEGPRLELSAALAGPHQLDNAAVAAALAWHAIDRRRFAECVAEGLGKVDWPGRLERIEHGGVTVILDCAHNEQAAEALATALRDQPIDVLLFGALDDKPWRAMLAILGPLARERVYCEPIVDIAGRRAVPARALADLFPGHASADPEEALRVILSRARPGANVLVTGSIFLVGIARSALRGESRDLAVPL